MRKYFNFKKSLKLNKSKYLYVFIFLTLVILGFLTYLIFSDRYLLLFVSKKPQIVLTKNGFQPRKLIVKRGTEVLFNNNLETSFWPASNAHPFHELYGPFDSKKAIKGEETWSFRFDLIGEWGFHDHIKPNFTGVVVVLDESGRLPDLKDCANLTGDEQNNCLYTGIKKVVEKKGLQAGFDQFESIYTGSKGAFDIDCHEVSHFIGKTVYQEHKKDVLFDLPIETMSMCGYGFFHGYIDALISDGEDLNLAKNFCEEYINKHKDIEDEVKSTCFHGIGHAIFDSSDYSLWGDDELMVDKSIDLCRKLGENDVLFWCADGVYSSLGIAYYNNLYNLSFKDSDPFWLCDEQPDAFRETCYSSPATLWVKRKLGVSFELKDAVRLLKQINYKKGLDAVLTSLVQEYYKYHLNKKEPVDILKECYGLLLDTPQACINGLYGGMIATNSLPSSENGRALCDKSLNKDTEVKSMCYDTLVYRR